MLGSSTRRAQRRLNTALAGLDASQLTVERVRVAYCHLPLKMPTSSRTAPLFAPLLGMGAVFASVPLIGYTMAVAAPAKLLHSLSNSASPEFASFVWELLVVFGPTLGVLLILCTALMRGIYGGPGVLNAGYLGAGAFVSLYFLVPFAYGEPLVRPLRWWASAAEASILVACALSVPLLRRRPS